MDSPQPFEIKVGLSIGSIKVLKFFLDRAADKPGEFFMGAAVVKRTGFATGLVYPILRRLVTDGLLESQWVESTERAKRSRRVYRITLPGREITERALAGFNDEMAHYRRDKIQKAAPEMLELLSETLAYLDRSMIPKEDWYKITPDLTAKIRKIVGRLTKTAKIENIP